MSPGAPGPTVRPTRAGHVALAAALGAATSWLGLEFLAGLGVGLPAVGAVAWASVTVLAGLTGWLAVVTHAALQTRREPMAPDAAVARLVLGKTSMLAGAAVGGAYLALVALSLGDLDAPLPRARALHGSLAVLAAVGWGIAGAFLERACRIPRDPDEDTRATPRVDPGPDKPSGVA